MKTPKISVLREHQLIPFPCHLDWEDLELRESGSKHCSECDCEVRDLTNMSADEIYALQDKLGGKLCGKIYQKNNYVVTEVEPLNLHLQDSNLSQRPTLTVPKIITGGIAALALASCSSSDVPEQNSERTEAQPFPKDKEGKPLKEHKESPCVLGIIALPPKK